MSVDSEQSEDQSKDEKQPVLNPRQGTPFLSNPMEFPKSLLKPLQSPQPKPEVVKSPYSGNNTQYESKDDGLIDQNFEHNAFSILYNTVVGYTDQSGKRIALPFLRLPNKRFAFMVFLNCISLTCLYTKKNLQKGIYYYIYLIFSQERLLNLFSKKIIKIFINFSF